MENWGEGAGELVFQYVSQDRYKDSAIIYIAGVQLPSFLQLQNGGQWIIKDNLWKLMPTKIVYGVQGSLPSSEVRDHGAQHPHYPEEVLKTHNAIGQAAA